MDITEQDIKQVHPDYPTQPEVLNVLYREHTRQVKAYFFEDVLSEVAAQVAMQGCPFDCHEE